jgi:hypothetical protein
MIKTPDGLKSKGAAFWKKVLSEYELSEAHDLSRLEMAAKCLDDLAEAEKRVEADGMFTTNRYGATVEHVGCKTIRDNRLLFVKIIRELALDIIAPGDSRPPRQY